MDVADDTTRPNGLSRRRFLIVGGAGVAATGLATELQPILTAAAAEPTFTLDLVRREDMAVLTFEFHNLALNTDGPTPMLNRVDDGLESLVLVRLGSQHLMEQPTEWEQPGEWEQPEPSLPAVGAIRTKAVGPSRIAFLVPQTVKSFPYTEDGLFEWWRWVMRVHARALAPDAQIPGTLPLVDTDHPGELQTDLLLTDWLHLSPDGLATWLHPARPVTRDGRTELWHTRLRLRDKDGRPDTSRRPPTIRAISRDDKALQPGEEVFTALRPPQQEFAPQEIVLATTDYARGDNVEPVTADLLLLSSLGSSVDLEGNWRKIPGLSIAKWLHRSTMGRDNYVRVETRGYLFPFGHRAVLVSETQRRIASNGVAYLFRKSFIVVKEPVKQYPGFGDETYEGRRSPFQEVRLTTTVTPDLPLSQADPVGSSTTSFWVPTKDPATGDVHDFPFPIIATDWEGRAVKFNASLAYLDTKEAVDHAVLTDLIQRYADYETFGKSSPTDAEKKLNARRTVIMSGEKIAFAEPRQPGDTAYPITRLYLGAYTGQAAAAELDQRDLPNFYPAMLAARVRLAAIEAVTGQGEQFFDQATYIGYDPQFTTTSAAKAAAANQADTFARVQWELTALGKVIKHLEDATNPLPEFPREVSVSFGGTSANPTGDKVGGVALPDLQVGALSRTFGPLSGSVGAISDLANGTFDPKDFFPESAQLLGGIKLRDIIQSLPLAQGGGGPTIITTLEYGNGDNAPPTATLTTLDWAPRVFGPDQRPAPPQEPEHVLSLVPYGADGTHATMRLHGEFRTVFGGESTSVIQGELRDFTLNLIEPGHALLDFIALSFKRFAFEQRGDAKPTFDPEIDQVRFKGPLSFINTLQEYLASLGGPSIDLQPSGVSVGYTLEIPSVAVGVFSLQNMSFSAGLTLPFDGSPVIGRFGFCSPENRFLVSVFIFGGGGYLTLELSTERLRKLEAAIEFGGVLALNIVIASGSLSVMAGIYFKLEYNETTKNDEVTLAGYLRAVGKLSVLGLITITAEFYLALQYQSADNSVEGIAILRVTVEVLFFSKTVELEVRKKFAGPGGTAARALAAAGRHEFGDLMSQADWNDYVEAFAG
ncbi:hypothetical protein [Microlunatus parietis]|uniref:Uncharacterized protein n=1 Tax=Microlunatus parietis TaxID=682979 RepID=A0A7Y9I8C7_9ACTN|nr:hypothetical protein [Microlunatus parietis]NYE72057.1 hypothetical protein [Microlunatus parietis]